MIRLRTLIPLLLSLLVMSAPAYATTPVIPSGQVFVCTPTHVWDGDGPIWCKEGPRVRLAGIAAREIDGSCKQHHPCPKTSGTVARNRLVDLIGTPRGISKHGHILVSGPTLQCFSNGSAGGKRTAAWCVSAQGVDINCAMVKNHWALKWDRYWGNHSCK